MTIAYVVSAQKKLATRLEKTLVVSLVEFTIEGGATTPDEFADSIRPSLFADADPRLGIILSGRGPIWGYAMLTHSLHHFSWVGVVDPRIGIVVVQSHAPGITAGDVWEFA